MKKRWTYEKRAELLALLETCTVKQVADYYKVTVSRIYQVRTWAERTIRVREGKHA